MEVVPSDGRIITKKSTLIKLVALKNYIKICMICWPLGKNFKNRYITSVNKQKMNYSLSNKDKQIVSKVDIVIFTVNKNIKKRATTYQDEGCSNGTVFYIYIYNIY